MCEKRLELELERHVVEEREREFVAHRHFPDIRNACIEIDRADLSVLAWRCRKQTCCRAFVRSLTQI